jgi:hypothetical protein
MSSHLINKQGGAFKRRRAVFVSKDEQLQLLKDLIEQCQFACSELIHITRRAASEVANCRSGEWLAHR